MSPTTELNGSVTHRRALFIALVATTTIALVWLMGAALAVDGFGPIDLAITILFAITLPWSVIGFWNATIGFLIMRFAANPVAVVTPVAAFVRDDQPITASTAILICIRNEIPDRVLRNLEPMITGLLSAGVAERFHVYVLSDTNDPGTAAIENAMFKTLTDQWHGKIGVTYRRRTNNAGFKAGNIEDFCKRWGDQHELAVTLDADSFVTAGAILRMVRVMQLDPKLGILQGLVVGMPSTSAFARIFQFGMRLGMRSFTIGSAWWQADCGPYWGHNAVLRLKPFMEHCRLPTLPPKGLLGGPILSHDQVEAVLMRRAGFNVRVLAEEELGWEENPPTLLEFIRRDLRWCQGNMQYWHLLGLPDLKPVSRYQLIFAILMFLGSPAWIGLLLLGTIGVARAPAPSAFIDPDLGRMLFWTVLVMWFAPKIASVLDVLTRAEARRSFGGALRFLTSVMSETLFFTLLSPIMWFGHTLFLGGLLFSKLVGWDAQMRDDHSVSWAIAAKKLWPQTLIGLGSISVLAATAPAAIPYALFIAGGLALAVPLAVFTSSPAVGRWLVRLGIGRLPEESSPPAEFAALALPAIEAAPKTAASQIA
ncbi:MAG TPA: glucans biosynthesis glucosyltransferase MdoH [Xanthobacteraceae bacterium]|nr:glucans biosynthesis glucosyltransferase MdoH [Xanthobacteraceae bacterium]